MKFRFILAAQRIIFKVVESKSIPCSNSIHEVAGAQRDSRVNSGREEIQVYFSLLV